MIDDDLRTRFDALAGRVTMPSDAQERVIGQGRSLRRRRRSGAGAALAVVLVAAVAIPASLAHQVKSRGESPSAASQTPAPSPSDPSALDVLRPGCTAALTRLGNAYGDVQALYGMRTSRAVAHAWQPQAAAFAGTGDGSIDLCLVVGDLNKLTPPLPPGVPDQMHYALLAEGGGGAGLVSASAAAYASPLPGIAGSAIPTFVPAGGIATSATGGSAVRTCTSAELTAALHGVGFPDGGVQAAVRIATMSAEPCTVDGDLQLVAVDAMGKAIRIPSGGLPGPKHGVYAPLPVHAKLDQSVAGEDGAIVVTIGGDPTACAVKDRHTTPAAFRITIGTLSVVVRNQDLSAKDSSTVAVYGCPARFYAGAVNGGR